jgi:ferrous iron transport protein B
MITVALAGNPNCGKTTIFNALTGTNQHVGNWPGVTVEKKEGILKFEGKQYNIVDLPGTYSLGAYSEDEVVARDFILEEKPDLVINVVDATNIERNLYLTTQLLEMEVNVIIALNMMDETQDMGIKVDIDSLSEQLEVPIVPTIAFRQKGIDDLKIKLSETIGSDREKTGKIDYGQKINDVIASLKEIIVQDTSVKDYPADFIALKLLENDKYMVDFIEKKNPDILEKAKIYVDDLTNSIGLEPEMIIVDKRYEFIGNAVQKSVKKTKYRIETTSDKIDKILTHKWLGLPIFILIMFSIYQLTFAIGEEFLGGSVAYLMESFCEITESLLHSINAPEMLVSFVVDGIFGGVGAVVEFVPLIMILYILLGILEDSGYMARAAYVMDRIMRALGLHGKTFISMLVGVGCNVPGIMSARTLDSKKDRMIAILINPFISCGARLPIYLVFISAFFFKNPILVQLIAHL